MMQGVPTSLANRIGYGLSSYGSSSSSSRLLTFCISNVHRIGRCDTRHCVSVSTSSHTSTDNNDTPQNPSGVKEVS
ncbi:hypothetical protein J6590_017538 [Homalodisca vitripennis]|nr:hypothetical protein J6590_017538 [Homalodisca vitripennis]